LAQVVLFVYAMKRVFCFAGAIGASPHVEVTALSFLQVEHVGPETAVPQQLDASTLGTGFSAQVTAIPAISDLPALPALPDVSEFEAAVANMTAVMSPENQGAVPPDSPRAAVQMPSKRVPLKPVSLANQGAARQAAVQPGRGSHGSVSVDEAGEARARASWVQELQQYQETLREYERDRTAHIHDMQVYREVMSQPQTAAQQSSLIEVAKERKVVSEAAKQEVAREKMAAAQINAANLEIARERASLQQLFSRVQTEGASVEHEKQQLDQRAVALAKRERSMATFQGELVEEQRKIWQVLRSRPDLAHAVASETRQRVALPESIGAVTQAGPNLDSGVQSPGATPVQQAFVQTGATTIVEPAQTTSSKPTVRGTSAAPVEHSTATEVAQRSEPQAFVQEGLAGVTLASQAQQGSDIHIVMGANVPAPEDQAGVSLPSAPPTTANTELDDKEGAFADNDDVEPEFENSPVESHFQPADFSRASVSAVSR